MRCGLEPTGEAFLKSHRKRLNALLLMAQRADYVPTMSIRFLRIAKEGSGSVLTAVYVVSILIHLVSNRLVITATAISSALFTRLVAAKLLREPIADYLFTTNLRQRGPRSPIWEETSCTQ